MAVNTAKIEEQKEKIFFFSLIRIEIINTWFKSVTCDSYVTKQCMRLAIWMYFDTNDDVVGSIFLF